MTGTQTHASTHQSMLTSYSWQLQKVRRETPKGPPDLSEQKENTDRILLPIPWFKIFKTVQFRNVFSFLLWKQHDPLLNSLWCNSCNIWGLTTLLYLPHIKVSLNYHRKHSGSDTYREVSIRWTHLTGPQSGFHWHHRHTAVIYFVPINLEPLETEKWVSYQNLVF